jgi:3-dehydroquinate synthase
MSGRREAQLAFSDALRHGEAVAIGLVLAFELSVRLGLCPAEDAERVRAHLDSVGLPTGLSQVRASGWSSAALLEHMRRDKKVKDGQVTFVLTRGIGKAFVSDRVAPEAVAQLLDRALAA